jgi:hypothetical protein
VFTTCLVWAIPVRRRTKAKVKTMYGVSAAKTTSVPKTGLLADIQARLLLDGMCNGVDYQFLCSMDQFYEAFMIDNFFALRIIPLFYGSIQRS